MSIEAKQKEKLLKNQCENFSLRAKLPYFENDVLFENLRYPIAIRIIQVESIHVQLNEAFCGRATEKKK